MVNGIEVSSISSRKFSKYSLIRSEHKFTFSARPTMLLNIRFTMGH